MNVDTRMERDRIKGTVRRVLLQYGYLGELLKAGASAMRLEQQLGRGTAGAAKNWHLTVGLILSSVDRDMRIVGAWKAAGRRLCLNVKWQEVADGLHLTVEGAKEVVTGATARIYAECVARGISEDYRAAA
jgi:hypothetical protein